MHRHTRSDAGDISSPRSSRAASFSSDRPSVAGSVTFQMPATVRPAPAYIAASVASQTVTDHHKQQNTQSAYDSDNEDAPPANALFSEQALFLLNAFLDHLLFAFLSTARSPALTAIRPAITDVLKPRLARDAMATADEELQGLLAGEEDEEFPMDGKAGNRWDVEKVWKRTRLRIMVYTRLGEFEDEDEERHVQQERGLSMDDSDDDEEGLVSWASAIFLTSVIEYVAEQSLLVSGQAAFARAAARLRKAAQASDSGDTAPMERIIVEEYDVEKLALNSALGRLWRTWRKRVRTPLKPQSPMAHGPRYVSSLTSLHRRRVSHDTLEEYEGVPDLPEHQPTETEIAANIPLPMGDNDVAEIEVPGLARSFEEGEIASTETPVARPSRPSSVIMLAPAETFRRRTTKDRPLSMPPPPTSALEVPPRSEAPMQSNVPSHPEPESEVAPSEAHMEPVSDDESYIVDERQEGMSRTGYEDEDEDEDDADMVAFAASTGMGFGMGLGMGPGPMSQLKTDGLDQYDEDTAETPTQRAYTGQPQVLLTKRLSIKETGPPGIVRTYSTRSSASTPRDRTPSGTPVLESRPFTEDGKDFRRPSPIGIAHPSSTPSSARASPAIESFSKEEAKGQLSPASIGGYVEVLPRSVGVASPIASPTARHSPVPERRVASPEHFAQAQQAHREAPREAPRETTLRNEVPRSDLSRNDVPRNDVSRNDISRNDIPRNDIPRNDIPRNDYLRNDVPQNDIPRKEIPRKEVARNEVSRGESSRNEPLRNVARRELVPPVSRTPPLAPLPESEHSPKQQRPSRLPDRQTSDSRRAGPSSAQPSSPQGGSPLRDNNFRAPVPKESPSKNNQRIILSRENSATTPERVLKQKSIEGSPRSRNAFPDVVEKSSLKRLSSSSSTGGRSASTSILHSARNSEGDISGRPRGLSGRMSDEDRERTFDSLVKGQETVKFTLTPENVRGMDAPVAVAKMAEALKKPESIRSTEPEAPAPATSTVTVYPRVSADKDNSFGSQHLPSRSTSRSKGPTASPGRSNRAMMAKPLAREPRIQGESMRDFADFIRSTGPSANQERPVQPFVSLTGNKSANASTSSLGGLSRKMSTKQTPSHSHSNSGIGGSPSRPRVHMEPRSPAGQRTGNDDLIDFIRQGPPGPNGQGQHRIPRNVAPFRTTVDSDQFDQMLDTNSNVESSTYGSQVSTTSRQSTQTANSRTGLLPAANVVQPAYSNAPQNLTGSMSSPEPQIQRTRRRIKDPYAIDLSDDEDDDLLTALPKSSKREESLMDFLNTMDPPTNNEPKPLVLSGAVVAAARARLPINGSHAANGVSSGPAARNGAGQRAGNASLQAPPISPPTQRGPVPRSQPRMAGARDATVNRSATNDLADFLRNSGPPEPVAPREPVQKEETKRRFWRRRTETA